MNASFSEGIPLGKHLLYPTNPNSNLQRLQIINALFQGNLRISHHILLDEKVGKSF